VSSSLAHYPRVNSVPGERQEDFYLFFAAMIGELLPEPDLEWLLCIDLAWIYWDIERFRRWGNAIIAMNQRSALEEALTRVGMSGRQTNSNESGATSSGHSQGFARL
jgi:hypothetical protein